MTSPSVQTFIPKTWALRIAHEASDYVAKRFNHLVQNTPECPQIIPPVTLDSHLVMACDRLVMCLTEAFHNPREKLPSQLHSIPRLTRCVVQTEIDIVRYTEHVGPMNTGHNEEKEGKLLRRFPPHHGTESPLYLHKPTTGLNALSRIIMWYLPGAFDKDTEVSDQWIHGGLVPTLVFRTRC